jgi:modulator of FtsH protease
MVFILKKESYMNAFSKAKEGRGLSSEGHHLSVPAQKVLKNTYIATALGLLFACITGSFVSSPILAGAGILELILSLVAMFALMFVALMRAEKPDGLIWYFAFTGVMGIFVGGMVNAVAATHLSAVLSAAAGTALLFLTLSAYVITTKRDLNHWGGFLLVAIIALILTSVINIFLQSPLLMMIGSAFGAVIFSLFIMYDTSRIVNGYEKSYVRASLSMFLNIVNLFIDLLQLILAFSSDD